MFKYKIVGMAQAYNEVDRGFLFRMLDYYTLLCDHIVILNDASTDATGERLSELENKFRDKYSVIHNKENAWAKGEEVLNKIKLHAAVKLFNPDVVISFDFDEIFPPYVDRKYLESVLMHTKGTYAWAKALTFPWISLWLGEDYAREDRLGQISPPRVWFHEEDDNIVFKPGLHNQLWPTSIHPNAMQHIGTMPLLHYSSVDYDNLESKVIHYTKVNPHYNPIDLFGTDYVVRKSSKFWFDHDIVFREEHEYRKQTDEYHERLRNVFRRERGNSG